MSQVAWRSPTAPERLLLNDREAAAMLHISPRTLWRLKEQGYMPVVRVGARVLYDVRDLRAFIDRNKTEGGSK